MGKRVFDLVVGTLLLLVALPLILVFAVALAITLRAWPFFVQERIGQYGRPFRMLKLRTLPPTTAKYALKHSLDLAALPAVSRFLRRTHLDELPQLLCVVAGTLSLVGPRPKMPDSHEPVDAGYAEARQSVKQGCTGLWQVGRDVDGLPHEAPEYDFFYIENRTLLLDLWILWRTVLVVAGFGRGVGVQDTPNWALAGAASAAPTGPGRLVAFDSDRVLRNADVA